MTAFDLLTMGFLLAFFFASLVFYSRIKENIGTGVEQPVFNSAKHSAKFAFLGTMAIFAFPGIGALLFGNGANLGLLSSLFLLSTT